MRELLEAARAAEEMTRGAARRDAFRTTRHLLAGARAAGSPLEDLADLFHVRPGSMRTRSYVDGLVPAATFARLTGVSLDELTTWQQGGHLPPASTDPQHRTSYPASTLINALLTNQDRTPSRSQ